MRGRWEQLRSVFRSGQDLRAHQRSTSSGGKRSERFSDPIAILDYLNAARRPG